MKLMQCQVSDDACILMSDWMFPIIMKMGCISSSLVCFITGVLSEVRMIGMMVAPAGS